MDKPICKVIGTDGNVFALIAKVSRSLREAGLREESNEMTERITSTAKSYNDALNIMQEYVKFE